MISPESARVIAERRKTPAFGAEGFDFEGLRLGMNTRREPVGLPVRCVPAEVGGVPGEWVVPEEADPDVRLLYLHGGGFVSGSSAFYLTLAARICLAARCVAFLPDYRLAPEHPFPAGLEDCPAAHEGLRSVGPAGAAPARATFIAGDSAGGGLTLSTLLALRDRGLALPSAAVPLSPFADLTLSGDSIRSEAELDPIMHPKCLPDFVRLYLAGADPRDPLASPAFADYTGLPALLIQVGEHEVIRDDSVRVAEQAAACGCPAALEVWPGMFHVFQSYEPLLPEGRQAIERIAAFLRGCC